MSLTVAISADHGGFELKNELVGRLQLAHDMLDFGSYTLDPADDYPDFVPAVTKAVVKGQAERGILICGSGVGVCIASNKVPGIRACLCHDKYSAYQGVEHDNMNVLCLGARIIDVELALELVDIFLNARFSEEERHFRRFRKVLDIEQQYMK